MGLSLVTGPTEEPVSLAEAKAHCRIDSTDDDGLLAGYILAARKYCEGDTRRAFLTQTWDYTIDYQWPYINKGVTFANGQTYYGSPYQYHQIILPFGNLQSVTSVTYIDQDGATQTLDTSQYTVKSDETSGLINENYGITWPYTRYVIGAITVRFVAGWLPAQFPDDLRMAMLMLIGTWYENRESVVLGRSEVPTVLPMATEAILSSYRISRIL